jgi:hypothetical protein
MKLWVIVWYDDAYVMRAETAERALALWAQLHPAEAARWMPTGASEVTAEGGEGLAW